MADQLVESARATVGSNGVAAATLQPFRYNEQWKVTSITVQSTSSADTECRVYKGGASPTNMVANTYSGKGDTASGSEIVLIFGDVLTAVWTGADVGSECTITIQGERTGR